MRLLRKILSPLALVAAAVGIILAAVIVLTNHDSAGPGIPPESADEREAIAASPGPEASDAARTAKRPPDVKGARRYAFTRAVRIPGAGGGKSYG